MYGKATYYGAQFNHRKTSSGEIFYMDSLTAASKTLPFGTLVKVTNTRNDKSVIVRITDRCPPINHNLLDLSMGAAKQIDMIKSGSATIKAEVVGMAPKYKAYYEAIAARKAKIDALATSKPEVQKTGKEAYAVQVGSFRIKSNAEKMTASLRVRGFSNNSVNVQNRNAQTLYKVTVGPYASQEEATRALQQLKAFSFDCQLVTGNTYAAL